MSYLPKDAEVQDRSLKVVEISIPFLITHNASPPAVVVLCDEPGLLFLNTQGVSQCTVANGAFDSSAEQSTITFASPNDASGVFNMVLRINEQIVKVVSAEVHQCGGLQSNNCTFPTGALQGLSSLGNKIVLNSQTSVDLATTDYNASLIVRYVVSE